MREVKIELAPGAELRNLQPDDADVVYAVVDAERERVNPWMPWIHATAGPEDILAFIERSLASEHDIEGNGIWVDDKPAGAARLSVDPLFNSGDIGYWIGAAYEGRELVTAACRALTDIAFTDLKLHRLTIHAAPDNARS